jgi:beta propeller repeat protein
MNFKITSIGIAILSITILLIMSCSSVDVNKTEDKTVDTVPEELPIAGDTVSSDDLNGIVIGNTPQNSSSSATNSSGTNPSGTSSSQPSSNPSEPLLLNLKGLSTLNSIEVFEVTDQYVYIFQYSDWTTTDLIQIPLSGGSPQWLAISSPLPYYGFISAHNSDIAYLLQKSDRTYEVYGGLNTLEQSGTPGTYKEFVAQSDAGLAWTDFGVITGTMGGGMSSGGGGGGGGGPGGGISLPVSSIGIFNPSSSSVSPNNKVLLKQASGAIVELADTSAYQAKLQMSNTHMVWVEYARNSNIGQIVLLDLNSNQRTVLSNPVNHGDQPRITDQFIVWEEYASTNAIIKGYNLSSGETLTIADQIGFRTNADISGNLVVWEDQRSGDGDIYAFDLRTGSEYLLVSGSGHSGRPRVKGNKIFWIETNALNILLVSADLSDKLVSIP